jgi:hypothetical protein
MIPAWVNGIVLSYGAGLDRDEEQTVQPFCQRLAGALSGFGYTQIQVRGARGLVGGDLTVNPSLTPSADGKLTISDLKKDFVQPGAGSAYNKLLSQYVGGANRIFVLKPWQYGTLIPPPQ